jgi:thiamine biosynthesis lipoprotein
VQTIESLSTPLKLFKRVEKLMGNRFELTIVANPDEKFAQASIDKAIAEISRIEILLTTFNNNSQTAAINGSAGIKPVKVDKEVFDLITRCIRISSITQGAFDITYGSIDKRFWNFDQQMTTLPDKVTAKKTVRLINYQNIILNEHNTTVFLKEKGMRIGFGGIGKGYAAERAKFILQKEGIKAGVVNAAGDLTAWGYQPNEKPWTIGIASPENLWHPFSSMNITDKAVATSGNYEKFVVIDGKKYSHTIDPKTGYPVSGIKSVTIICPNAEIADALATPVMVMGVKAGLDMINQLNDVECIIIDEDHKLYTSNNIKLVS